ncbi:MAG: MASE1 domain-containing protein [Hyphomonadaceae bacterium]
MIGQGSIWLRAPAVGAGYFLLSLASLSFSRFGAPVESIWLSNALLLAALIATPRKEWLSLILCASVGHVLAHMVSRDALDLALSYLAGDMVECALCATLLAPRTMAFETRRQILWFLLVCALIGPFVSASIAASGSAIIGKPMEAKDFAVWFAADALGMITFLPLLHGFGRGRLEKLRKKPLRLAAAVVLVIGFSVLAALAVNVPALRLLLLPLMVLVAFELGVAGAEICLACMMVTWTIMTITGHSPVPWATVGLRDAMLVTQVFLAVFSATILPLAVLLEQKERLTETLANTLKETQEAWGAIIGAEARYRMVVDHVSETVMRVAPGGLVLFASPACASLLHGQEFEGRNLFSLMQGEEAAREQEYFEQSETRDLLNLINRRTWRIRGDKGGSIMVDARVTMIQTADGGREFVVVLRPLT